MRGLNPDAPPRQFLSKTAIKRAHIPRICGFIWEQEYQSIYLTNCSLSTPKMVYQIYLQLLVVLFNDNLAAKHIG